MIDQDCLYTTDHEWIRVADGIGTVGISDYAQEQLGDMTFVDLPAVGTAVSKGEEALSVESCKAAIGVAAPAGGTIVEVNAELEEDPARVNTEPYGDGWMIKIEMADEQELADLMSPADYETFLAEL